MVSRIDDYTLGRTLGSGFSAKVKECMDANGTYAIKIINTSVISQKE